MVGDRVIETDPQVETQAIDVEAGNLAQGESGKRSASSATN
jgi:hypothetical protein